ncbi:MAG TPA: response regulator [Terriglobales bacterium]|jgi:CheY-like chemotaxis protein|nr:response regulator [Terriglobales bacterium]
MGIILIVEDTDTATPLEIALSTLDGMETRIVSNGLDALAVLHSISEELAAIVTDLHLPFIDGFEIVAAVRSHPRYAKLPIIVVSGDNHPDSFRRVLGLGANVCFSKPYSPCEVRRTLEDLLHAA